jgi:hypothetical protein
MIGGGFNYLMLVERSSIADDVANSQNVYQMQCCAERRTVKPF